MTTEERRYTEQQMVDCANLSFDMYNVNASNISRLSLQSAKDGLNMVKLYIEKVPPEIRHRLIANEQSVLEQLTERLRQLGELGRK